MARIRLQAFPAQFTPTPFQNLAYIAEKKQAREDKAFDLETTLESEFNKIGALDPDIPEKNRILNEYRQKVADSYTTNKDNPNAMLRSFKEIQRNFTNELTNGKLGGINQRYQSYVASKTEKQELGKKHLESGGEKGVSNEDATQSLQYELTALNAEPIKQTEFGGWESYKTTPLHPTLSLSKIADNIGKEMREKPSSMEAMGFQLIPGTGFYRDLETSEEVVEAEAIRRAVVNRMLTDPAIQGYVQNKNKISGTASQLDDYFRLKDEQAKVDPGAYTLDGVSYNPAIAKQVIADQVLNKDIYNAANTSADIYKYSKSTLDANYLTDWQSKVAMTKAAAEPAAVTPQTFSGQYTEWRALTNPYKNMEFIADPKGNILTDVTGLYKRGMTPEQVTRLNKTVENNKKLKVRFDQLRNSIPQLKTKSDKEIVTFMNEAYSNANVAFDEIGLADFNIGEMTPQVLANMTNQSVLLINPDGKSSVSLFADQAKKAGYTSEEFRTAIEAAAKAGRMTLSPFNPLGKAGYSVELAKKDGNPIKVTIGSSKEMTDHFGWLQGLYSNFSKGQVGFSAFKLYPEDWGTYTGIGYDQASSKPFWYVGRVLNADDTKEILQNLGITKAEAEAQGIKFSPSGGLIRTDDINDIIKQQSASWLNSKYMNPFRVKGVKQGTQIVSDED
jgi:hypothetical protein